LESNPTGKSGWCQAISGNFADIFTLKAIAVRPGSSLQLIDNKYKNIFKKGLDSRLRGCYYGNRLPVNFLGPVLSAYGWSQRPRSR
jgi:hypothetical protein